MPRPGEDRSDVGGAIQFNNIGPVPLSRFINIGPVPLSRFSTSTGGFFPPPVAGTLTDDALTSSVLIAAYLHSIVRAFGI
jgi:hypothetical protein